MEFIPKNQPGEETANAANKATTTTGEETENYDLPQLETLDITGAEPADSDLSFFGDPSDVIVHPRALVVDGKKRLYYVRELDYRNLNKVNEKKWRKGQGGRLEFDTTNADNNVAAMTIHLGIVKPVGDPNDLSKDNWTALYSLDQLLGVPQIKQGKTIYRQAKPGLLDNGREEARLFLYQLQMLVWDVNPSLNPMILAQTGDE